MSSVTQKCKLSDCPGWKSLHVHQLPDLHRGRIDFPDQSQERWMEVLEHLDNLVHITLLIPFCFWSADSIVSLMIEQDLPSPGLAWDSVSGCMQTKLSSWLSLHGYMTTLRSEPYHIAREFVASVIGLVTGSSRPAFLGIKNRKAALPDPYSLASLMQALDFDCGEVSLRYYLDVDIPKLT